MLLSCLRTGVLYLFLLAVIRMMGKRQIGEMEPTEFVVTMLVANLASIPMEELSTPLLAGLVPMLTVLGAELLLSSLSLRSIRLRKLLCGKPVILIENGRILQRNLQRTCITLDELTGQLRQKDVLDLKTVQYAILETNGSLSVFPYPEDRPASAAEAGIQPNPQQLPITIVADGRLMKENLAILGKDRAWVQKVLQARNATIDSTWLLTADRLDQICFYPKEGCP